MGFNSGFKGLKPVILSFVETFYICAAGFMGIFQFLSHVAAGLNLFGGNVT